MPEDSPKSAPGQDLEEKLSGEQLPGVDAVQNFSVPVPDDADPADRKTLDLSEETDGPMVEIGQLDDLASLPHELQIEIALAELDDYQLGIPVARQQEDDTATTFGLNDSPDPAFLIVPGKASPSLAAPALPADLVSTVETNIAVETVLKADTVGEMKPNLPSELRETIVPEIPITMDMSEFEEGEPAQENPEADIPTEKYSSLFMQNLQHLEEFYQSRWGKEYQAAHKKYSRELEMHVSRVVRGSNWPKPPLFDEYFAPFLEEREKGRKL